jgi:hypothetical protein
MQITLAAPRGDPPDACLQAFHPGPDGAGRRHVLAACLRRGAPTRRAAANSAHGTGRAGHNLDTRDLDVRRVTLTDGKTEAPFTLGDPVPFLGHSLAIQIPPGTLPREPAAADAPLSRGADLPLLGAARGPPSGALRLFGTTSARQGSARSSPWSASTCHERKATRQRCRAASESCSCSASGRPGGAAGHRRYPSRTQHLFEGAR